MNHLFQIISDKLSSHFFIFNFNFQIINYKLKIILALGLLCLVFSKVPKTFAQISPTLSISPAKYELQVEPGQISEVTVKLTNQSAVPLPVQVEVMDFAPNDDHGGIDFTKSLPGRSAKTWLSVADKDMVIKNGETRAVRVTIYPPEEIEPGGYFAVVMFQPELPSHYFDSNAQAKVVPWIGELFLLNVGTPSPIDSSSLTVKRFLVPRFSHKADVKIALELANNTNYSITPSSEFVLQSLGGSLIAQANEETTILPGTSRTISATLQKYTPLGMYWGKAHIRLANYSSEIGQQPVVFVSRKGGLGLVVTLIIFGILISKRNVRIRIKSAIKELIAKR